MTTPSPPLPLLGLPHSLLFFMLPLKWNMPNCSFSWAVVLDVHSGNWASLQIFTCTASSFSLVSSQLKSYLFTEGSLQVMCSTPCPHPTNPVILCHINLFLLIFLVIIMTMFNSYLFILPVLICPYSSSKMKVLWQ